MFVAVADDDDDDVDGGGSGDDGGKEEASRNDGGAERTVADTSDEERGGNDRDADTAAVATAAEARAPQRSQAGGNAGGDKQSTLEEAFFGTRKRPAKHVAKAAGAAGENSPSPSSKRPRSGASADDDSATTKLFTELASSDYEPLASATWSAGKPAPYRFLADAFERMSQVTARVELTEQLTRVFRSIIGVTPADLLPAVYLVTNKLAPANEGLELGVGDSIVLKALASATGRQMVKLRDDLHRMGDLGDVAVKSRTTQRTMFPPPPLTVRGVYEEFVSIAKAAGRATMEDKARRIQRLLVSAKESEAKFLARALQGKLRIGIAEKTLMTALAAAVVMHAAGSGEGHDETRRSSGLGADIERASRTLRAVFSECPSWDAVVPVLLKSGAIDERLQERCKLTPGLPVGPMLAKASRSVADVIASFSNARFTCEYKYDGERAQLHRLPDGLYKIYSRNAEDHTAKYPDLAEQIPRAVRAAHAGSTFIVDAEVVAYDREAGRLLPFQAIQQRARKNVTLDDIKTRVCLFVFDVLYLDGRPLTKLSLEERREHLHALFEPVPGEVDFVASADFCDVERIQAFMDEAVAASCEGLMVKALDGARATYEPANRTQNWLKLKKDYLEGVGDTLDLVPIGAFYGRGKRTGWFGSFLLACYDPDGERFETVTKIGTGFSEEQLQRFHSLFVEQGKLLDKPRPYFAHSDSAAGKPDVWLDPCQVWEVQCADLSLSPAHMAAFGHVAEDKGISVRFPRLLRVRDDKESEEATTSEQIVQMYREQFARERSKTNATETAAAEDDEAEEEGEAGDAAQTGDAAAEAGRDEGHCQSDDDAEDDEDEDESDAVA